MREETHPLLSVIIPVYNAESDFFLLLTDLVQQKTDFPFEIIVADDGSVDDTVERINRHLKELSQPCFVRLLTLSKNKGPAAARNFAIQEAKGKVFLLIDADCRVPTEDYLARSYQLHLHYPQAIIGGGVQGCGKGLVAFMDRYCHWATNIPSKTFAAVDSGHLVTANMLIPRTVFEKIGPFDSSLRTGEDTAFCFKAHKSHVPLRLCGDLVIQHHDREDWKNFLRTLYIVGQDRADSRQSAYGEVPWFLGGPEMLRWFLVPLIASALTIKNLLAWWHYDKRVMIALPGIFLGMLAMAIGVARGRKRAHL